MATKAKPSAAMFDAKGAGGIYSAIVSKVQARVGPELAVVDPKQTCVHIIAGKGGTAYAGIHPRRGAVLLNIRLQTPPKSKRFRKVERVSANRCHCEVVLKSTADVNAEIIDWLEEAAKLISQRQSAGAMRRIAAH